MHFCTEKTRVHFDPFTIYIVSQIIFIINICTGPIEISPFNFTQSLTNDIKAFQKKDGLEQCQSLGAETAKAQDF